jgi:CheY-like chemotaxis protein
VFPTGARFVVELPAIARDSVRHVEPSLGETTLRRALIVDDEPDVAASLADILGLMGLRPTVETTWQGRDNLMDIDADIIFSDLRMPGISTIELYRQLLALRPDLAARFVIVTGDMIGARADIDQLPVRQRPQLLEKPFSTLDVRGALSR